MTLLSHATTNGLREPALPDRAFIGGTFAPALSGETMPTVNPATGKEIALVASCGREDVDKAVAAARKAFESGAWSRMHPSERKKILMRFIGLIEKHQVELAVLESLTAEARPRMPAHGSAGNHRVPRMARRMRGTSSTAASPPPETAGWGSSCASPPGWSPASCRGTSRS